MPSLPLVTLADAVVRLSPLSVDHVAALFRAASASRGTYGLTRVPSTEKETADYVEQALGERERGQSLPFVIADAVSGRAVGSTRFMNVERWVWPAQAGAHPPREHPDALEIGSTWLAEDAQRTGINTHAKLLLLGHAFEAWAVRRVTLKTDARNQRSRNAIQRIGAKFDGVLRAHMPAFDGAVRDTAFYSIVLAEWPEVRTRLEAMLRR